jgi:ABC-2 type transport system ATP-binding protein
LQVDPCAIAVRDVEKAFVVRHGARHAFSADRRKTVLRAVNIDVRRGELMGLLGPNGVGKTTLLKMMATLMLPDAGSIRLEGIDIETEPLRARALIGYCGSEDRSFYFRLTARENLAFFGALAGLYGTRLKRRIRKVMEDVGLEHAIDRRFGEFSSGMRQRMTVARALLADPPILFFDEPTRAVDPLQADEMRRMIRRSLVDDGGKTVVLATNILEEAWSICDRVAIVSGGTIAAIGRPNELTALHSEFDAETTPIELFRAITADAL